MNSLRCLLLFLCVVGTTVAQSSRPMLKVGLSLAGGAEVDSAKWMEWLSPRSIELKSLSSAPTMTESAGLDAIVVVGQRAAVLNVTEGGSSTGLVVINDFIKPTTLRENTRSTYGAVAENSAKRWQGAVPLFFTPMGMGHPISARVANFEVKSGFAWNLDFDPAATVLASTWTPHQKKLRGGAPQPYVYGVTPVLWTLEKEGHRTVGMNLQGTEMLHNPAMRALVIRSLAWAAKRTDGDAFCTKDELASLAYPPDGPLAPEAARQSLKVHPDFEVSLVAAEPLVSKALNIDWDAKGRLWMCESLEYPEGKRGGGPDAMYTNWQRETNLPKPPATERPGRDRISWLEDTNGDGRMDAKHVFADDLDMVTSFCFYRDGVIVAQPPVILFLRDTDGDGKADTRETLYAGLGTFDTHAVLNNLRWGLDGWIYATHGYSSSPKVTSGDGKIDFGPINSGIIRFRPDGSKIEMRTAKSGNCWGVDITSEGELFFTQPTSGDLVMHAPVSDHFMAEGGMGREPSWKVLVHLRPVEPLMSQEEIVEQQPNDVIGSFTAACGCTLYEGGSWPKEWTRSYFTAEPTVHIIHHEEITPNGASFVAKKIREGEFSATRDWWHRPIDTRIGLDGDLYVTDFYNQAILHNDPRGPIHLWNNQAARPDRDHFLGRIYRYKHKSASALPNADLSTDAGLIAALGHPNREVRFKAQRLIEETPERLKALSAQLTNAEGAAKLHALWLRAAATQLEAKEILAAIVDADSAVQMTMARVLAEHPTLATGVICSKMADQLTQESDLRVRLMLLAAVPTAEALPSALLVKLAAADDAWTRAAVLRNALPRSAVVWREIFTNEATAPSYVAEALISQNRKNAAVLAEMLEIIAEHGPKKPALALTSLQSLGREAFASNESVKESLTHLLGSKSQSLVAVVLPLASQVWSADERNTLLPAAAEKVLALAQASASSPEEKSAAYVALARLPLISPAAREALQAQIGQTAVLDALCANSTSAAADCLIGALKSLSTEAKAKAIESLLSRRDGAMSLISALSEGSVTLAVAGPSVLNRLINHPDREVAARSAEAAKKLRGAMEARDAIIARLLPEVTKPGNPDNGKALFAACAVCHQFKGQGVGLGPVLDGIGIHSAEVLLTHIIDPNREVEPSFHSWNVAKKNGELVAGIISRETASSLFIKNAAGEIEVPRDTIASQTNTGSSLMPEGFENLGAAALRDMIAYLQSGSQQFHAIPFGKAATADGSQGVYLAQSNPVDRVSIKKYGVTQVNGVPFSLPDPASASNGRNVIVLKGGAEPKAFSHDMPEMVELPVNHVGGRLHLLGGVAGWGWPVDADKEPLVEITVHYAGGETEVIQLKNGVEFADHIALIDVPGSVSTDLVHRGQLRYLWRDLKHTDKMIERVTLRSFNRRAAPMIAALTLESPSHEGKMAPAPKFGGPSVAQQNNPLPKEPQEGKLRVLLAGGGNSHNFQRWFDLEDQRILKETGKCVTFYAQEADSAVTQLDHTDVFVLSANDARYQRNDSFREALQRHVQRGGGLVLLHPATWYNWMMWTAYNLQFVGGGAKSHDPYGEFGINVLQEDHPVMAGLPLSFSLKDELYHVEFLPDAKVQVLAETTPDASGKKRPSVWITEHPTARIVCLAPGHDEAAHTNDTFQRLLQNAVLWAGKGTF